MIIEFGYGKDIQTVDIPDSNLIDVLVSNPVEHERRGPEAVQYALEHPVGTPMLRDIAAEKIRGLNEGSNGSGRRPRVVIITSDVSRPLPSYDVLPSVLDELYAGGCVSEDISVVIALGSHRSSTEDERRRLVGDRCYSEVEIRDSSREDLVHLGTTSRGTPVDYDRLVTEADMRICLGNIECHYCAGYSGGCKAIMPGVSTAGRIYSGSHTGQSQDDDSAGCPHRQARRQPCQS